MADQADPQTQTQDNVPARREQPRREIAPVQNIQPLFDTAKFEHMQRAATALMHSSLLPESVRGNSPQQCFSNLLLIFEQAERWRMPGTALAQCISVVHNKLVYEGKAVNAGLEGALGIRLHFHYTGERGTDDYRIYVSDRSFDELTEEQIAALKPDVYPRGFRMIDGSVRDWKTFQKDGRTPNPAWVGARQRNQLAYRGTREWARLYESGAMLGVYGDDEIDAYEARLVDVTPRAGAGPGLSAGFTRPAEGEAIDAEFTEAAAGGDQGGDPPADAGSGATTGADADQRQAAAGAAGSAQAGPDHQESDPEDVAQDPQGAETVDPEHDGEGQEDADQEALEQARRQEAAAAEKEAAQLKKAQEAAQRTAQAAEQKEAKRQAALELEPEKEDESTPPPKDAFDLFGEQITQQEDWESIKTLLAALATSPAWKAATPEQIRSARISAGIRLEQLIKKGLSFDITTDITAFRCWAEWQTDPDMVRGNWDVLVRQDVFKQLKPDRREQFEGAIGLIIQRLQADA